MGRRPPQQVTPGQGIPASQMSYYIRYGFTRQGSCRNQARSRTALAPPSRSRRDVASVRSCGHQPALTGQRAKSHSPAGFVLGSTWGQFVRRWDRMGSDSRRIRALLPGFRGRGKRCPSSRPPGLARHGLSDRDVLRTPTIPCAARFSWQRSFCGWRGKERGEVDHPQTAKRVVQYLSRMR
jgi:hypothetical protein